MDSIGANTTNLSAPRLWGDLVQQQKRTSCYSNRLISGCGARCSSATL